MFMFVFQVPIRLHCAHCHLNITCSEIREHYHAGFRGVSFHLTFEVFIELFFRLLRMNLFELAMSTRSGSNAKISVSSVDYVTSICHFKHIYGNDFKISSYDCLLIMTQIIVGTVIEPSHHYIRQLHLYLAMLEYC